jgi:hypothetical protein
MRVWETSPFVFVKHAPTQGANSQDLGQRGGLLYRRRAGSRSAWCRISASALTRAYLASDLTDA